MRIKKIIATSMQEAHLLVEKELGSEAIILSNRNIKLADGSNAVEISAAVDVQSDTNIYSNSKILNPTKNIQPDSIISNEINKKLISEVSSMKELLMNIAEDIKYKYTGIMPESLSRVFKILIDSDISEEFALNIIGKISAKGFYNDFNQSLNEARNLILKRINFAEPLSFNLTQKKPLVVYFVGSTGMGKTSALIKLAIISKLLYKVTPFIISTDTYKIGGIEQLQTLSSIAGINFSPAYTSSELAAIIDEEKKNDIIFIDTVGLNPNNIEQINSVLECMNIVKPNIAYLVLSATAAPSALSNIINKFSVLSLTNTIITKLDEVNGIGNVVNAIYNTKLPLAYFTMGQQIPDDIELASSNRLNDYLFLA